MMKRFSIFCIAALLATGLNTQAQQVPVVEKELSNGMTLLMLQRKGEPSISGGWVAKVGSSNERPGITGIAHLFEHMMFKGTPTLGTKDYEKDQKIIAEQERVRDLMRQEEAGMRQLWREGKIDDLRNPENATPRYKELEAEFKKLIEQQREILVKNEFDKVYTAAGASGMNAFTTSDLTGYFITVPSNRLEFWMWMESERLYRPVFREFYAERDVVFEERRMRTEATPLGQYEEQFESMFWVSHPYNWPVIGWPSDIPAISKAQADEFYGKFYAPQNITLVLVGDFDPKDAESMAEKYFGRIAKGKQDAPDVITLELEQKIEKRMNAEVEANPQVSILWHSVPFRHPDSYPLEVLAEVLSSRTGRLYKSLVIEKQLATSASARQDQRKWAGAFNIKAEAKGDVTPAQLEEAIYEELEKLKEELVPDREIQKVKNNFAAYEYRKLANNFSIMIQLIFYEGLGDWNEINDGGSRYQAVTSEDIQRVVKKYFTKETRAVATYTRKAGAKEEDPALAGLSAEQKSVVRMISSKLKAETSIENLQKTLAQFAKPPANAGEEDKQMMKIYKSLIQKRIEELKSNN